MNTIEEYYEFAENGIQDHFTVANALFDVANKSTPEIALNLLIEAELLNTCTYRNNEFAFWTTVSRYKFEKLGFQKIEDLIEAVVSYLKARLEYAIGKNLRTKVIFVNDGPGLLLGSMWDDYSFIEEASNDIIVVTLRMIPERITREWLKS